MQLFELVIGLLIGAAILTTLSKRIGIPYPVVLALAGTALAFVPADGVGVTLDPDLALALFVAPVLLDAAYDTSLRDLRANWVPVLSLVLFCVVVTIAAVAFVAHWLVPDMPWAVAIALGAIVAPPDATAATAVLRLIAPPYRMLVVLEGESLLNDASALLIYRLALGVAAGGSMAPTVIVPALLLSVAGGAVIGFVLAKIFPLLIRRLDDIPVNIVMQFAGTFGVWLIAEAVGASPVLTVVVYAMTLARAEGSEANAANRRTSFAVWDVATYTLNALAFVLVGLQLHPIIGTIGGRWGLYAGFSLAVLATVVLARIAWVMIYNRGWTLRHRWTTARHEPGKHGPSLAGAVVVSWCGMRGVVTLATALALPFDANGAPFPHRDLLVAAAFTVVLGTLLVQGTTLKPLLRWLDLHDDGEVGREERLARHEVTQAALAMLRDRTEPEADPLRKEYKLLLEEQSAEAGVKSETINGLRLDAIATERKVLHRLRRNHTIGDGAYHTVQEELDWAEGHASGRRRGGNDEPEAAPADDAGRAEEAAR